MSIWGDDSECVDGITTWPYNGLMRRTEICVLTDVTQADNQNRLQRQVGYRGGRLATSSFLRKQDVIPAKAGTRLYPRLLDSRVRGNDDIPAFAYAQWLFGCVR
jgi:hypothetical protein